MDLEVLKRELARLGVFQSGHFKYRSGKHGEVYLDKDSIYLDVYLVEILCQDLAKKVWANHQPQVVAGPAMGGIILSNRIGYWLSKGQDIWSGGVIKSVYAEKKNAGFVFRQVYARAIRGKSVLIVEDIINTGGTVIRIAEAIRNIGGVVSGAATLINRGQVKAEDIGIPHLISILDIPLPSWEVPCPLCLRGIPLSEDLGHGGK